MKKVDRCYIWTAKLVPNINQANSPWLVLKRKPAPEFSVSSFPASEIRDPSNTPLSFTPTSSSALSFQSSSSSSCSCSSSPTSCSSSSSLSSPSQSPTTRSSPGAPPGQRSPMGEAEKWTCEIVEGHCKIIIRRQPSEKSMNQDNQTAWNIGGFFSTSEKNQEATEVKPVKNPGKQVL